MPTSQREANSRRSPVGQRGFLVSDASNVRPRIESEAKKSAVAFANGSTALAAFLSEEHFRRMLSRERKRSERSRKHFVLMLIDGKGLKSKKTDALLEQVAVVLGASVRETDVAGWFETNAVFGVIFTEFGECELSTAVKIIEAKMTAELQRAFRANQLNSFQISFYSFPDGWNGKGSAKPVDAEFYPDLFEVEKKKKLSLLLKRVMDILGGVVALILLSPVFLVLAILVKLTSKGPVFFRQQRVGRYGVPFEFLKFRSMHVSTDAAIHKEYVRKFIAGKANPSGTKSDAKVTYKITNDPRVTWIGKIMRRASLDEIPQFWNVLQGQMSLVGPRPPIPYELETYDIWHRRRVLESRPGITGLWQVHGRSKTTFDEMVRLDLQYSRMWSPMLDVKILLQTPRAVLSGDGAY
jgi:lipopolysaccharide/colanic/teichoic acid biosynthesis glycosyltransferase/GGDEF domain-containing protein